VVAVSLLAQLGCIVLVMVTTLPVPGLPSSIFRSMLCASLAESTALAVTFPGIGSPKSSTLL